MRSHAEYIITEQGALIVILPGCRECYTDSTFNTVQLRQRLIGLFSCCIDINHCIFILVWTKIKIQLVLKVLGYYSIFGSVGQLRISSKKGVLFSSTHFTAYR